MGFRDMKDILALNGDRKFNFTPFFMLFFIEQESPQTITSLSIGYTLFGNNTFILFLNVHKSLKKFETEFNISVNNNSTNLDNLILFNYKEFILQHRKLIAHIV